MKIEYETKFPNVNRKEVIERLKKAKAILVKPEFFQKRVVFHLPKGNEINGGWLRVRDEGDKITMSLKVVDGAKIENQKEICLEVNNFDEAVRLLEQIGCRKKAYQESKRELWKLDGVEVSIDEWPFLEPYIEIEGKSEREVKEIAKKLGFDYKKAVFGSVDILYTKKYGVPEEVVCDKTPEITFSGENPFA